MSVILRCIIVFSTLLCSFVYGTESGDLLDAFNEVNLEDPNYEFEEWSGTGDQDSTEFKAHYAGHFKTYVDLASKVSIRAIACANGDLVRSQDYQPMTDVSAVYALTGELVNQAQTQLSLWINFNDQDARVSLDALVPKLTISYSRMLFELSNCSGYLYGELVN
ncbi:hypothetical protein [Reinekea sp.]|jgi:hypothetical protein|uniref:hypothetical protein n=1 Tax=Reinekea sp. TaxID=1970455 RepID=UPI002A81A9B4|nr:hypothetical protein [Reinekea sp.]